MVIPVGVFSWVYYNAHQPNAIHSVWKSTLKDFVIKIKKFLQRVICKLYYNMATRIYCPYKTHINLMIFLSSCTKFYPAGAIKIDTPHFIFPWKLERPLVLARSIENCIVFISLIIITTDLNEVLRHRVVLFSIRWLCIDTSKSLFFGFQCVRAMPSFPNHSMLLLEESFFRTCPNRQISIFDIKISLCFPERIL